MEGDDFTGTAGDCTVCGEALPDSAAGGNGICAMCA